MLNLTYHSTDNGFCRVYYKAKERPHSLYCMQSTGQRFELLICSRDGEPESPIRPGFVSSIQPGQGDESTDTELNLYLETIKPEDINV